MKPEGGVLAGGMTFASDAVKVLDALGVAKAVFICQSMGGTLGMHAATFFADRVSALVRMRLNRPHSLEQNSQQQLCM